MVDRLTPENCEQYGITWDHLIHDVYHGEWESDDKDGGGMVKVFVHIHEGLVKKGFPDLDPLIFGTWDSETATHWHPKFGRDLTGVKAYIRRNEKQEPKTIQIFHEPIKPSKSAAIAVADTLVANVKSMLEAGNITEDEAMKILEQAAAAKEMANKAYEDLRNYMGERMPQGYLYASGSKFEVRGGKSMSYDYSKCDSIKEFDIEIEQLSAKIEAAKANKKAKQKSIAAAYQAQRYGDLKRIDPETGAEYIDIPTPISGKASTAFTLAQ